MLNNLKVGARLYILVGALSIFMVAIGVIGLRGMSGAVGGLQSVYEDRTVPVIDLAQIQHLLNSNFTEVLRAFQHDPGGKLAVLHDHPVSEHAERVETNIKVIDALWKKFMATRLTPEESQLAETFTKKRSEYVETVLLPTLAELKAGNYSTEIIGVFLKTNRKLAGPMNKALEDLIKYQDHAAKEEHGRAVANYKITHALALGSIGGGLVLGFIVAWLIIRSITTPLNQMRATIGAVEKSGDFTHRIPVGGHDEAGQAANSFNELMATLQSALRQILDSVGQVSDAVHTLSSSSSQVASSSAHQSEAASSMASTVEQVTVSINHVSENACKALAISRQSGDLSSQGGNIIHNAATEMKQIADTVRQTSATIENLGQQSNQISSVVQVIKDVADQTNLLALNAAIEAARAGEQGRGFAVVADEVRKLAERTTKATEEITQMIVSIQNSAQAAVASMSEAVEQVGGGVALAEQAGEAINQIKDGSGQVIAVVDDISTALAAQSDASNDIAAHVERVAQMSEENSAAAKETASAATHLEQLANAMRTAVSRFRI